MWTTEQIAHRYQLGNQSYDYRYDSASIGLIHKLSENRSADDADWQPLQGERSLFKIGDYWIPGRTHPPLQ